MRERAKLETSAQCQELGTEKKKARGARWARPPAPARFLFFDYCYFYCDTQREPLRRRELSQERFSLTLVWKVRVFETREWPI